MKGRIHSFRIPNHFIGPLIVRSSMMASHGDREIIFQRALTARDTCRFHFARLLRLNPREKDPATRSRGNNVPPRVLPIGHVFVSAAQRWLLY